MRYLIRILLVLAVLVGLGVAVVFTDVIRTPQKSYSSHGEILTVVATTVTELDRVLYSESGQNFVIEPLDDGNTLALVKARVLNQQSAQVSLSIDNEAGRLSVTHESIKGSEEFFPLYFREYGKDTEEKIPEDYLYSPFLWGEAQINKGFELSGWMIFEVPKGSGYLGFAWDDVEFIKVIYPK
jgi:hypothetical protein